MFTHRGPTTLPSKIFCLLPLLGPGREAWEVWQFNICSTDKYKIASFPWREGSMVKSCLYPSREIISNPMGDKSFIFLSPSWDDSLFDLLQSLPTVHRNIKLAISDQTSGTEPLAGASTLRFRGRWASLPCIAPGWLYVAHGEKFPSWHTSLWDLIIFLLPSTKRSLGELYHSCFHLVFSSLTDRQPFYFCFSKR